MAGRSQAVTPAQMSQYARRALRFCLRNGFALLLVLLGLCAQLAAVAQLLTHSATELVWSEFAFAQLLGATLLTVGLVTALPSRYQAGRLWLGWVGWSLATIVPLLGAIGVCLGWLLLLILPGLRDDASVVVGLNTPHAGNNTESLNHSIQDSLCQLLMRNDIQERRHAIMAVRQLRPEQALPILSRAVRDTDESVRMFALGCLQRIATQMDATMHSFEEGLPGSEPDPRILTALAEQYHELVYLGLAEGHRKRTYLQRALTLTRDAAALRPDDPTLWMNHLRYTIHAGDLVAAEETIARLKALGSDSDTLAIWELEFLFLSRRWMDLIDLSRRITARPHPKAIAQVLQMWVPHEPQPA